MWYKFFHHFLQWILIIHNHLAKTWVLSITESKRRIQCKNTCAKWMRSPKTPSVSDTLLHVSFHEHSCTILWWLSVLQSETAISLMLCRLWLSLDSSLLNQSLRSEIKIQREFFLKSYAKCINSLIKQCTLFTADYSYHIQVLTLHVFFHAHWPWCLWLTQAQPFGALRFGLTY